MNVLNARNVHQALPMAVEALVQHGVSRGSRNGLVRQSVQPTSTVYMKPNERVMYWPARDANPFFHLFEALWMLAGRNDLAYVERYVKRMRQFSDNGKTLHGAYGHRWRNAFGFDQLTRIIDNLRRDKLDRRQVLTMFSPMLDLEPDQTKMRDVPCNLMATFQVSSDGGLDMCVFNRSNDVVWGCYGANAVHFSLLQEYVACCLDLPVGTYTQVSVNWHGYEDTLLPLAEDAEFKRAVSMREYNCPYTAGQVSPLPLLKNVGTFELELGMFLEEPSAVGYTEPFFRRVAVPMHHAWTAWKTLRGAERYDHAAEILQRMPADNDWRLACEQWIQRRRVRWEQADDDGVSYE